jgi:hypothetical protein
MATSDEVDTAAGVNALGPRKVQQGTNILEQHDIDKQIALSKHLRSCAAPTDTAFCGIGVIPTIPPAAG